MTPTSSSLEEALFALLQALDPLAVPYCVIGALAVGMWGRPRATTDLDILIAVAEQDRPRLLTTLEQQGFLYDRPWAEANPMIRQTPLRFRRGGIPADLLLPRNAHDDSVLQRRRQQPLGTRSLSVIAPEDLILYKLRAGRPRDFEDALSVLQHQRDQLDGKYLETWARRIGVVDELSYCRSMLRGGES